MSGTFKGLVGHKLIMFLSVVLKLLLIFCYAHHTTAGFGHFQIHRRTNSDIDELANILKYYITSYHSDNGRFIMIRYLASDSEEFQRQTDLAQALISNTRELDLTYMFIDFKQLFDYNCHERGLVITLFDDPYIIQ